ncbi:hypothetical protein BC343_23915 [Mucilaginibacter pedocola]|uniref:Uncharacterized protein n=2 Tax=Mucilaginibacter pedocola TaxID=1792845 RepID=A0A1S9PI69_9SPHI|nr:hypothetical protein BC343_23915 [Mucilaginibacter pedocola]
MVLLIAAGAISFEAPKETKVLAAGRLLCRTSLCPANRAEPRAGIICPLLRRSFPALLQTIPMPLQPHAPTTFCPLSPEASLLPF